MLKFKMTRAMTIREMLTPGRRLDVGRAAEVAALLLMASRRTGQVVECLWDEDRGVANRAADALERASSRRPEMLVRWKESLLHRMLDAGENKLRWNLALTIFRTPLSTTEAERGAAILRAWLDDKSSIVKTCAMHGLAGLTRWDPSLLPEVLDMLRVLSRSGTPAMRARGRILLKRMEAGKELPVVTGDLPAAFRQSDAATRTRRKIRRLPAPTKRKR
jgi:hypothetical protein